MCECLGEFGQQQIREIGANDGECEKEQGLAEPVGPIDGRGLGHRGDT